ncbi:hypothetical protein [Roseibium litorale]|uniref:Uncharacterized protein n=1 Tax=Roseibium litorale TaxID=2803841 RepID=A0ABR9CRZ4_9HYPH|nr:hypothetical protein [Roseibium litorale]MBD8893379.1 hypothetical protein [Roseibium litorale]
MARREMGRRSEGPVVERPAIAPSIIGRTSCILSDAGADETGIHRPHLLR